MITRIEAENYRCFRSLGIDLGRYHVLAGANGAGKTTLLDIPVLLGDLLRARRVSDAFLQRQEFRPTPRARSLDELTYCGRGDELAFAIEARLPSTVENKLANNDYSRTPNKTPTHLRYELRLTLFNFQLTVEEEHLHFFSQESRGQQQIIARAPSAPARFFAETRSTRRARRPSIPDLQVGDDRLALATVPADEELFEGSLWFARLLRDNAVFYEPDWATLRQAAPPGDPPMLMPSARNTPWLALALKTDDAKRFGFWVDHVQTALPQVSTIDIRVREDDRHAYFVVDYVGGHRVTSSGLSDGTLRILAFSLLPYLPGSAMPQLLVTEEPENGIHPQAIETVVQSLSSIYDSQVIVSTHSPVVLAQTKLADVLAARLDDDGCAEVVRGDEHPRLRDWHGSLDLGSLFASGVLS